MKMANFDMRDQKVQYQYNADIINLNNVSNRTEFVREMENISSEIARASTLDARLIPLSQVGQYVV